VWHAGERHLQTFFLSNNVCEILTNQHYTEYPILPYTFNNDTATAATTTATTTTTTSTTTTTATTTTTTSTTTTTQITLIYFIAAMSVCKMYGFPETRFTCYLIPKDMLLCV